MGASDFTSPNWFGYACVDPEILGLLDQNVHSGGDLYTS